MLARIMIRSLADRRNAPSAGARLFRLGFDSFAGVEDPRTKQINLIKQTPNNADPCVRTVVALCNRQRPLRGGNHRCKVILRTKALVWA
jgi:hypothetical protein